MPALKRKLPSVNLLPTEEKDSSLKGRTISWLLGTFRFLVITVELVVIVGFLSRFFLDSQNSDLTDNINQKKALIQSYLPFENDFKRAQARLDTFNKFAYSTPFFGSLFATVTKNVSADTQLSKVQRDGSQITLVIIAKNEQSISSLIDRLKKEDELKDIGVSEIEGIQNSDLIQATLVSGSKTNTNAGQ